MSVPTNAPAPGSPTAASVLAEKLRSLRSASRLTLQQLSQRTGISVAALSKIENGQLSPTYEKIAALAAGLSVDVGELFRGPSHPLATARRSITYRGQGLAHQTPQYLYEVLHSDLAHKKFIPLVTTIRAHNAADFSGLLRHDGEEFIYVLSGKVIVLTDSYEPLHLEEGDSCYFDSSMGHVCVSGGPADAQVLWICSHAKIG